MQQAENLGSSGSEGGNHTLLESLKRGMSEGVAGVIESESHGEELVAYAHLLSLTRKGGNHSLIQESHPLYDKVFYKAESIKKNPDGTYVIVTEDAFVRLNDKIDAPGTSTVSELRNKSKEGILFSGVAALSIETKDGRKIPLLRRDAGAPTDAGKYTLPAGRADKSPGLTAYEECLEEIIIMGKRGGKYEIIVPLLEGGGIPESKAKLLVGLARRRYLTKLLEGGEKSVKSSIQEVLDAPLVIQPLSLGEGENVKTIFDTGMNEVFPAQCVEEGGIHPFHDEAVNTFEFIRSFSLDMTEYSDIQILDGDGFGRETDLFREDEVRDLAEKGKTVASLNAAQKMNAFTKTKSNERGF